MNDREFDKMMKNRIQEDKYIDEKVNELFSSYKEKYKIEREDNMKVKNNLFDFVQKMRYVAAILVVGLVIGTGGMTYAHISGIETIISPILRNIGINSKYEENATDINQKVDNNSVEIEMLDLATDESALIVGYTIDIKNINMLHWIEVDGIYKINDMTIKPINQLINKDLETKFIYYQVFDMSEIELKNTEKLIFTSNISEISEYTEVENLESNYAEYLNKYRGKWNFEQEIVAKNIEENKVFELNSTELNINGINISAEQIVKSSYTNMLKIKTDQSKYNGDAFEQLYIVYDENNKEIVAGVNEYRDYDYRVYTDRIFIENINLDSELRVDVYINNIKVGKFEKVGSISIDMKKAEEIKEKNTNYAKYNSDDYSFKHKNDWKVHGITDKDDVGPYSRYLNCLHLESPTTTNEDDGMDIFIAKRKENVGVEGYVAELIKGYENEYSSLESKKAYKIDKLNGYEVITINGEYVFIDYIVEKNGYIYNITFGANEIEYNNQKDEIKILVESFEIK